MALLSQLIVRFGADIADFTSDMDRAARISKQKGDAISASLTRATAVIGAGFVYATYEAGAFEKKMAEVSTLVDTHATDMAALEQAVLDVSAAYGGDAKENAEALYQIISSGAEAGAEAVGLLDAANRLAVGGVTDVKTAADGLTTILNAWGISTGEVNTVSDQLFATMRAGKTTIGEISAGIGQVATVAAQTSVPLDELLAGVATLTLSGINTNEAMTALRGAISAVIKPSDKAKKAASDLGIEFNASALASKGLAGFLADIQTATGGSAEELVKLFGRVEGLTAVMAIGAGEAETYNGVLEDIQSSAGATEEAVGKMSDTLDFKMRQFKTAVQAAGIELGNRFLPYLTEWVGTATGLIRLVADHESSVDGFNGALEDSNVLLQETNRLMNENLEIERARAQAQAIKDNIEALEAEIRKLGEKADAWYATGIVEETYRGQAELLRQKQKDLYDELVNVEVAVRDLETATGDIEEVTVTATRRAVEFTTAVDGVATAAGDAADALGDDQQGATKNLNVFWGALSEMITVAEDAALKIGTDIPEAAEEMADSFAGADGVVAVMEQAWQKLDSSFQSVWENFFETGRISLSNIRDLFTSVMAQLAHEAITRPIVMQLGAAMGLGGPGQTGSFGELWATILQTLPGLAAAGGGGLLAGSLFDGNNAALGGALGGYLGYSAGAGVAGILSAFGPISGVLSVGIPIVGALVGALLGGVFGDFLSKETLPQLLIAGTGADVAGKIGGYGNKRIPFSTAFGDFMVYNQNDLGPDGDNMVAQFIQNIKDFDKALASVMTDSQLQTVKDNLANWGWEWTAEAVNIQDILTHRFDQVLEHFGYLTEGIGEYVNQFSGLEERTAAFMRFVAAFNAMGIALKTYITSSLPDLVDITTDSRTSGQRLSDMATGLRDLFANFERTPESMEAIAQAISQRYQAEIEYIQAIDALIQQIGASIERQRASLRGMLGQDESLTASQLLARARSAMAGLGTAGSPEEIAAIVANVQQLVQSAAQAAGNLPEELAKGVEGMTRDDAIRAALLVLDQLENAATSRANILRENALAEAMALREEAAAFAEAQQISLDDIVINSDATVVAIDNQTVVIGDGNQRIGDGVTETNALLERLIVVLTEKNDVDVIRGSKVVVA